LHSILNLDPHNANAFAELGMLAFVRKNYSDAARQFESALSISPSLWNAQAFLGMCRLHLGATSQGRKLIEDSLTHVTDRNLHIRAGLELVNSYHDSGFIDKAGPILEQLEEIDPSNSEVLYAIYRLHSEIASAALRKLTAGDSDSAWVHEILGQNYFAQEQYTPAVEEFRKAIDRANTLSGLHYQLGEALFAGARNEESRAAAEKEFRAELALNPNHAESLYQLCQIALERQDFAGAKPLLLQALAANPDYADARAAMSKIYEHEGDTKNAISELEVAEKLSPTTKTTHYRLAQLYRQIGRSADSDREMALFRTLANLEHSAIPGQPIH
jgi:tetratricopeptide (TPR) repeat protein